MEFNEFVAKLNEALKLARVTHKNYNTQLEGLYIESDKLSAERATVANKLHYLDEQIKVHADIDSLISMQESANLTIDAADNAMKKVQHDVAEFEQYKANVEGGFDKVWQEINNHRRNLEQRETILSGQITDFNKWKDEYVDYKPKVGG